MESAKSFVWQGPGTVVCEPFTQDAMAKVERLVLGGIDGPRFLEHGDRFEVEGCWFDSDKGPHFEYFVDISREPHRMTARFTTEDLDERGMIKAGCLALKLECLAGQEWRAALRHRRWRRAPRS